MGSRMRRFRSVSRESQNAVVCVRPNAKRAAHFRGMSFRPMISPEAPSELATAPDPKRTMPHATTDLSQALQQLFSELSNGPAERGLAYMLNTGDIGLLRSLDKLPAAEASHSVDEGATIAAHAQHLRYGLSLMNRWATHGGNPFADAKWDEAWKLSVVSDQQWAEIRQGLREEAQHWLTALGAPRETNTVELMGVISSIAHLAYHLGAIRQIAKSARGPREGTFL